jgi:hypothetical protein
MVTSNLSIIDTYDKAYDAKKSIETNIAIANAPSI